MTSVRLPESIDIQLDRLCGLTKRSKSFYIKEALSCYLEDIADQYIAMDRISQPKRHLLSTAEIIQEIESGK